MKDIKNFNDFSEKIQKNVTELMTSFRPKTRGFITWDEIDNILSILFKTDEEKEIENVCNTRNAIVLYTSEKEEENNANGVFDRELWDLMSAAATACDHLKANLGHFDRI